MCTSMEMFKNEAILKALLVLVLTKSSPSFTKKSLFKCVGDYLLQYDLFVAHNKSCKCVKQFNCLLHKNKAETELFDIYSEDWQVTPPGEAIVSWSIVILQ